MKMDPALRVTWKSGCRVRSALFAGHQSTCERETIFAETHWLNAMAAKLTGGRYEMAV